MDSMRFRRSARQNRRCRKSKCSSLTLLRRHRFELLEDRRVLDLGALGEFVRLDRGPGGDLFTRANGSAEAGDIDEYDPGAPFGTPTLAADIVARTGGGSSAQVSDAIAASVAQALAEALTPIGSATAIPLISTAAAHVQSIGATGPNGPGSSSAAGGTHFELTAGAAYVFDDADEGTGQFFHGNLLLAIYGSGQETGDASWDQMLSANVEVLINSTVVASIDAVPTGRDEWTVTITEPGVSPIEINAVGGANQFVTFTIPFGEGETVEFRAGHAIAESDTFAQNYGIASINYASVATAWGFVTGTVGGLPEADTNGDCIVDGLDMEVLTQNFGWSLEQDPSGALSLPATQFDGDLDHDGDVDQDDFEIWVDNAPEGMWLVSTNTDESNADYSFGDLSLREVLNLVNDGDTIYIAPWVELIDLDGTNLIVADDVEIVGAGPDKLMIDAQGASNIMVVMPGVEATIRGLTMTGGDSFDGGAIFNWGDLTLEDVAIVGNVAENLGGGIASRSQSTSLASLTIRNSSIDGNSGRYGAGINVDGPGHSLVIDSSTVSNNVFTNTLLGGGGGGLRLASTSASTADLRNSTVSGNRNTGYGGVNVVTTGVVVTMANVTIANNQGDAGGGLRVVSGGAATLHNTIVAENKNFAGTSDSDVAGTVATASSYNLFGRGGSGGKTDNDANHNVVLTGIETAGLAALANYGGLTKTHALLEGSQALDHGSDTLTDDVDQRGVARPYDLPASNGAGGSYDIGAYEAGDATPLIVRIDDDRLNGTLNADNLSLREALALAATLAGKETITIDPALYESGPATITLTNTGGDSIVDPLTINTDLTLAGPGADKLIIDASSDARVIYHTSGTATIEGVTITGGNSGNYGGGIRSEGDLTLRASRVTGNSGYTFGGGIASFGPLLIVDSEISDNALQFSGGSGAGIAAFQFDGSGSGDLTILNSTISGNDVGGASSKGGGIAVYIQTAGNYETTIVNSTISNNSAGIGGGLHSSNGGTAAAFVELHNTIVAGNFDVNLTTPDDIGGNNVLGASSHNLIGSGGSGGLVDNDDGNLVLTSMEPVGLTPLDFYGGTTRTHALYSDSLAIDAGDNSFATSYDLEFDQRGYDRIVDWDGDTSEDIDIGALELALLELYS